MSKLSLIKNPELFQGQKYLNQNKKYFEGWYFKNTGINNGISFIPGINIDGTNKKAFIQVITNNTSYFIDYDINDFSFSENPFYIKIQNNIFSKENIHIDIIDEKQHLKINGDIKYSNSKNINVNILNPNIMGPFSYIPFMECNHAILSMKNTIVGAIKINDNIINLDGGNGYIEKDWGFSFSKTYIWCQGNNFQSQNASFLLAIANIPFKIFEFKGIICDFIIDDEEFKFTSYNNTRLIYYVVNEKLLNITLKKENYYLNVKSVYDKGLKLAAPIKGEMKKDIFESISGTMTITLKKKDKIIFLDTSTNCGMEIVKNDNGN